MSILFCILTIAATIRTETQWTKYTLALKATATSNRIDVRKLYLTRIITVHSVMFMLQALSYQLVSAGTVWIDLLQLIPNV